ncbi:MAG: hypothetical protein AAFY60_12805, partial [Myxococcota bacterium]
VRELATEFEASGFKLSFLFERFFSSQLATDTSSLEESRRPGSQVSIARRAHFCHAAETRLDAVRAARGLSSRGEADICDDTNDAQILSGAIPDDEFVRGAVYLEQPSTMEAFTAVAFEGLCATSASEVVSPRATGIFDSEDERETMDLLVEHVLGSPPSSARFGTERAALQQIYDAQTHETVCAGPDALGEALESESPGCGLGLSKEDALRNIWTIACQSPLLTGIGL